MESHYVVDGADRHGALAVASYLQKPFSLDALQRSVGALIQPRTSGTGA